MTFIMVLHQPIPLPPSTVARSVTPPRSEITVITISTPFPPCVREATLCCVWARREPEHGSCFFDEFLSALDDLWRFFCHHGMRGFHRSFSRRFDRCSRRFFYERGTAIADLLI